MLRANKINPSTHRALVLGDSHARAYGMNNNFTPIFLGSGKIANFTDWSRVDALLNKCKLIHEKLNPELVVLCLGEPDTRYAFGLGWQPWESEYPRDEENFSFLEKCSDRYTFFVNSLEKEFNWEVKVQNIVLTQDISQCRYIDFYNDLLTKSLGSKLIYFNERIRTDDGSINREYSWDRIHANSKIVSFIESELGKSSLGKKQVTNKTMKKYFRKNPKFSSFEIPETKRPSLMRRIANMLIGDRK